MSSQIPVSEYFVSNRFNFMMLFVEKQKGSLYGTKEKES